MCQLCISNHTTTSNKKDLYRATNSPGFVACITINACNETDDIKIYCTLFCHLIFFNNLAIATLKLMIVT